MILKQLQKLGRRIRRLNWKTWAAISVISLPLFYLNVPGHKVCFITPLNQSFFEASSTGDEFSHGWPFVAVNTLRPSYDIEDYRDRNIKGPKQYVYPRLSVSNMLRDIYPESKPVEAYTRDELRRILNREIRNKFQLMDPPTWNEEAQDFETNQYFPFQLRLTPEEKYDETTVPTCFEPSWRYAESWPLGVIGVKCYWYGLACNLLIWIVVCSTVGLLVELAVAFTPGVFKFRLWHLLAAVGFFSVIFAIGINIRRQFETEREIAESLEKIPGVEYTFTQIGSDAWRPIWLARLIGTHWEQSHFRITEIRFLEYNYTPEQIAKTNKQLQQLNCLKNVRIKSTVANKHQDDLPILATCPNLTFEVNSWAALVELRFNLNSLKSLDLIDSEYRKFYLFDHAESSKARCKAIEHLDASGYRGAITLISSGSLTKAELDSLQKAKFSQRTLFDCTVDDDVEQSWLRSLDIDLSKVRPELGEDEITKKIEKIRRWINEHRVKK